MRSRFHQVKQGLAGEMGTKVGHHQVALGLGHFFGVAGDVRRQNHVVETQ